MTLVNSKGTMMMLLLHQCAGAVQREHHIRQVSVSSKVTRIGVFHPCKFLTSEVAAQVL